MSRFFCHSSWTNSEAFFCSSMLPRIFSNSGESSGKDTRRHPHGLRPLMATSPTGLQVRCANLINLNDINLINLIILLIFIPILFESSKHNSRMLLRFGEDHRVKHGHFVLPRPYEWGSPRPKQGPARASTNSVRSLWRNRVPWSRKMAIGVLWIQICQVSGLSHWKSHWKGHGRSQHMSSGDSAVDSPIGSVDQDLKSQSPLQITRVRAHRKDKILCFLKV